MTCIASLWAFFTDIHLKREITNHWEELRSADQVLVDVVMNIQVDGICKHFADLFDAGQGLLCWCMHTIILKSPDIYISFEAIRR